MKKNTIQFLQKNIKMNKKKYLINNKYLIN